MHLEDLLLKLFQAKWDFGTRIASLELNEVEEAPPGSGYDKDHKL